MLMNDRRMMVVANWKMNLNTSQASLLLHRLQEQIKIYRSIEVVLAPNSLVLQPLSMQIDRRKFRLAAQNAYHKDEGAFTGEISMNMLRELAHYCIIGHSERRIYFDEDLNMVRDKVAAAIRNDIQPILCVGENKTERRAGETKRVIHDEVTTALRNLTAKEVQDIVIAYEPIWAISTFGGKLATPDQAKDAMDYVREVVRGQFGNKAAKKMRVLYGGSVDDQTAKGYLDLEGCDGVLVGGASLNYHKFSGIVKAAQQSLTQKENNAS